MNTEESGWKMVAVDVTNHNPDINLTLRALHRAGPKDDMEESARV